MLKYYIYTGITTYYFLVVGAITFFFSFVFPLIAFDILSLLLLLVVV